MHRYLPVAFLLLGLTACSATKMDVAGAVALANAIGDTQAADCYTYLTPILSTAPAGLLSGYEAFRGSSIAATGPCAPIFAGLALHVLNKVPFTP